MKLKCCPICKHNTGMNCSSGRYIQRDDQYSYAPEKYFILCKACKYKVEADSSLLDAQLKWNNDIPSLEDYKYYVEHGWISEQTWQASKAWEAIDQK